MPQNTVLYIKNDSLELPFYSIILLLLTQGAPSNSSIQRMNDILMMIQFQKVFNNKCEIIFFGKADARGKETDGSDRTIARSFVALNKTLCVCSRELKLMNDTRDKNHQGTLNQLRNISPFCARACIQKCASFIIYGSKL